MPNKKKRAVPSFNATIAKLRACLAELHESNEYLKRTFPVAYSGVEQLAKERSEEQIAYQDPIKQLQSCLVGLRTSRHALESKLHGPK